jgi:hypothetical protein
VLYKWKVRLLKQRPVNVLWRYWRAWRGDIVGDYNSLPDYIRRYAPGCSFVDIGCMWGVNGAYAFVAEEAGAVSVKAVDVFGPTPEFEATKRARNSSVEFILGDATHPDTLDRIGVAEVVFCAGSFTTIPALSMCLWRSGASVERSSFSGPSQFRRCKGFPTRQYTSPC